MSGLATAWLVYLLGLGTALCAFRLSLPAGRAYSLAVLLLGFLLVIPWRVVEDRLDWWGPALLIALFDATFGDADASWVLRPVGLGLAGLGVLLATVLAGWLWLRRRRLGRAGG